MTPDRNLYSQLPAIDKLLRDASFSTLLSTFGHTQVVNTLREMLETAREYIRTQQQLPTWNGNWAAHAQTKLESHQRSALQPVFNLTGTVLHTNLGRALQAEAAIQAVTHAVGYLNFRRVSPGWCVDRPHLVKLVEKLFERESFARTEPPTA